MSGDRIYNIISVILLIATVIVIIVFVGQLLQPPSEAEINVALLPPTIALPSDTPTVTPSITLTATQTFTPTSTFTPTTTLSPTPTTTTSPTITTTPRPTDTPSITPTPSDTDTPTPTETPTGPTATFTPSANPFPFSLREPVRLTTNFANPAAGCNWQGIGGDVLDINGARMVGSFQVRVFNSEIDQVVLIGTNSLYGESGWEVAVSTSISPKLYFVQLETTNRVQVSPRIEVQFPGTCEANAGIMTFIQTRAF